VVVPPDPNERVAFQAGVCSPDRWGPGTRGVVLPSARVLCVAQAGTDPLIAGAAPIHRVEFQHRTAGSARLISPCCADFFSLIPGCFLAGFTATLLLLLNIPFSPFCSQRTRNIFCPRWTRRSKSRWPHTTLPSRGPRARQMSPSAPSPRRNRLAPPAPRRSGSGVEAHLRRSTEPPTSGSRSGRRGRWLACTLTAAAGQTRPQQVGIGQHAHEAQGSKRGGRGPDQETPCASAVSRTTGSTTLRLEKRSSR
jgi:hypothetical protein